MNKGVRVEHAVTESNNNPETRTAPCETHETAVISRPDCKPADSATTPNTKKTLLDSQRCLQRLSYWAGCADTGWIRHHVRAQPVSLLHQRQKGRRA